MAKAYLPKAALILFSVGVGLLLVAGSDDDPFLGDRREMVRRQIEARGIKDQKVLDALRHVPRHRFVATQLLQLAYQDSPLPIGYGQTISQPYIVALMTELLEVKPEHRILEVGTGSGYQAAILAELAKEVYTIEIIPPLGDSAQKRLAELGYQNITTRIGDGYFGWPEKAPFDGIIVTAAATDIPPPLLEQLKPTGRMVIPVGNPDQTQLLKLVTKNPDGPPTVRTVEHVRFVPLRRSS
jgi:protein-L-isoaspartate(D-aspartate) O-methyltransferase